MEVKRVLQCADFFALDGADHAALLAGHEPVWRVLTRLGSYVEAFLSAHGARVAGHVAPGAVVGEDVYIGAGTVVEPGAFVLGPAVIGPRNVIRHGAYVREAVVTGAGCVIGHASEIKGSLMLEGSAAPHFNYVGDSLLGRRVNLGAGTKLSNVPMAPGGSARAGRTVVITIAGVPHDTGLAKLGAVLGDDVHTGCNSVTNPGCLVGPRTVVYPNVSLPKGYYPPDRVVKLRQQLDLIERLATPPS